MKQALFHLTDNAARHTPPGGSITIGWEQDGSSVKLRVADEGEGIPPEDLPSIFEPFYRGDRSRSRRRGGTGLALVENIVRSHRGRLQAESPAGRGSHFIITLPNTAV
ncbi:sensor histidine kinase [Rubrobacter indicoceani]|uniref:sensor histidine kinase n=1 Tax=Rubrobacter indicoceani TaxID=2051957 RepID=UPI0013C41B5D|nr:sensor histidine kinase [Rubrobacter indicoceani]